MPPHAEERVDTDEPQPSHMDLIDTAITSVQGALTRLHGLDATDSRRVFLCPGLKEALAKLMPSHKHAALLERDHERMQR